MRIRKQRGAILIASLMILSILSFLAIASITVSTNDMQLADNAMSRVNAEILAQRALEKMISDINNFENPNAQTLVIDGKNVMTEAADCVHKSLATGYSALWDLSPEDTQWHLQASFNDPDTQAEAVINEGVVIRMVAGNCI